MNAMVNMEKGASPFSPGRPVPLDMFVGRDAQVKRMLRSVSQVVAGKQENLFVTGEYGIGKSSLVAYVRHLAQEQFTVAGFHVFLGGVTTVEDMVQRVVSRVIQQAHRGKVLDKIKDVVGKYVKEIGLFGVKLNTEALRRDLPDISHEFLPFLRELWGRLQEDYKGIALFLDDLNGITKSPEFAALIKSLVDEIATGQTSLPLLLTLSGVPERRTDVLANQPSVERIFDIVELSPLSDEEVASFFKRAFESANMVIQGNALDLMVHYSGGLPKLMHELGDAVFWKAADNDVALRDVMSGVVEAANIVGRKYFEPVRQALRSSDYLSILTKLGSLKLDLTFRKKDLAKGLNESERRKLNNFLQRMKKLNALHPGEVRGQYAFPNRLIQVYLLLESSRTSSRGRGAV